MNTAWKRPELKQHRILGLTSFEATPFVWQDRLYLVENFHRSAQFPAEPPQYRFHEDGCLIRDVETDTILAYPWLNHYFSTVNVINGKLVLIGGDFEWNRSWWRIRHLQMMESDNLTTWSKPVTVLEANDNESMFNNCLVHDGEKYVLLYETDDPRWEPKFTFRFAVSHDLVHWEKLPEDSIYGIGKYVGGPGMYWEGGYYYLLYLAETNGVYGLWETRITRSRNLKDWEDAPAGRPFVAPNLERFTDPVNHPGIREVNASDVELIEFNHQVQIWWNGGDQEICGDLQHAVFDGSRRELLEAFFA